MTTSQTSGTAVNSGLGCACGESARSACAEEPPYGLYEGNQYCVFHFPGEGKTAAFEKALARKHDYNFQGFRFPCNPRFSNKVFDGPADFSETVFNGPADFMSAVFNKEVKFFKAVFCSGAYFNGAEFCRGASFKQARFNAGANFSETTFKQVIDANLSKKGNDFSYAAFNGELAFLETIFEGPVTFYSATFKNRVRFCGRGDHVMFEGISASLDLQNARVERPEWFSLCNLTARPSWFVYVDPRKFDLANIKWNCSKVEEEIASLEARKVSESLGALETACRRLAVNAEESGEYRDASKLRYMALAAGRRKGWRGVELAILGSVYWVGSGYGERVWQAALMLVAILVVCAALYSQVGFVRLQPKDASESEAPAKPDEFGEPLKMPQALIYSAAVLTFQRPEPPPQTIAAQTVVILETILGSVQAALLALAIRRKFMR